MKEALSLSLKASFMVTIKSTFIYFILRQRLPYSEQQKQNQRRTCKHSRRNHHRLYNPPRCPHSPAE
jgi:hypothetical protein